ncbi:MAG: OmpA family protein [Aquabacterium sp.]|nr:MAG: OmpA family protein [Aquabacterium sp.]
MKNKSLTMMAAIAALCVSSAHAQTPPDVVVDTKSATEAPYAVDSRDVLVRNSTGLCWRTGSWTLEAASKVRVVGSEFPVGCYCDKSLLPKETCEAKVVAAAPVPPAPAPAPAPVPVPQSSKVTIPTDTLFAFDKAVLTSAGKDKLNSFAEQLKGIKLEAVVAVGHTDRIGSTEYNQKLSEKRAAAVKAYLVEQGVEAQRIFIEGRGESQPTTGDQCKDLGKESGRNKKLVECLQPDRRVDIEAVGAR